MGLADRTTAADRADSLMEVGVEVEAMPPDREVETGHLARIERFLPVATHMGVAILGEDGRVGYANPQFATLLGLEEDTETVGQTLPALIVASATEKNSDWLRRLEAITGEVESLTPGRRITLKVPTSGGHTLLARAVACPDGPIVIGLEDITAIHQKQQLLDIALDSAEAGYWSLDITTNHYTFSESVTERLSESERQKISKAGLWSIVERDDVPDVMSEWMRALREGDHLDITYRVHTERGTLWQRSIGQIDRNDEGHAVRVTCFVRDITEDVNREQELVAARETASAKTEFLARMSHEVRTPLNAIIGLCDLLRSDYAFPPEVSDILADIDTAACGLEHLLTQTLDHSKLVAHKVELDAAPCAPLEIARELQGLWAPQARVKHIGFTVGCHPDMPQEIVIDRFRLGQCLNNLASNAVKFTESGAVGVRFAHARDHLVVRISDTGIGMDADAVSRLSEPFEQAERSTTRRFGGTGLGMAITYQLVELMGGHIKVDSEPGRGTVFTLILPARTKVDRIQSERRAEPEAPPQSVQSLSSKSGPEASRPTIAATLATPEGSARFSGLKVLCVEDNPTNRSLVRRLLSGIVGELHFAENGAEALDVLDSYDVDVILMDVHMPVMDGIETTIAIRNSAKAYAKVVIIALTADADYQHRRVCRNLGMNDTIGKPVRRREILDAFARNFDELAEVYGAEIPLSA